MTEFRTEKYTNEEFLALERNADGDLLNMFDAFLLLTEDQVAQLSGDDWSRYYDYKEELDYEMAALSKEFGL